LICEKEKPLLKPKTLSVWMDFQVVVLAGGVSKKLLPLVSHELPNALLPVANRPVLSYVVELLELSNLKDLIVVCYHSHQFHCFFNELVLI